VLLLTLGLAKVYSQDPYIGEIRIFAGNFAPSGWALCNGQILPIAQNTALFSILGTTYGGDGTVNFALPDFRGRTAMGVDNGHVEGERGGEETHILTLAELPTLHAVTNLIRSPMLRVLTLYCRLVPLIILVVVSRTITWLPIQL